ncbi:MAG: DUF2207 domain-containing protein [Methanomicrobiaceae archaeon]|nr:DUF2207 domain-containing protein [Methanomicrobiaceae archaeon]
MEEKKQITILFLITFLAGLLIVLLSSAITAEIFDFSGDLVADSYEVVWYESGSLTESYVYDVRTSGEYRMLYRVWKAPLIYSGESEDLNSPYIKLTGIKGPEGSFGYLKTNLGRSYLQESDDRAAYNLVSEKAYDNEVGIVNPGYFAAGKYTVVYEYLISPPVEYDNDAVHINLKFADEHIPYNNVKITLISDKITDVFSHPSSYEIQKEDDRVILTGHSPENEIIEAEFLMKPEASKTLFGYKKYTEDILSRTKSANEGYLFGFKLADALSTVGKIMVLLVPFLFVLLYFISGREKKFTVPEYLSTIPDRKLLPWQVNLIFKDDAFSSDENAFYATILLLHKKRKISIKEKDDKKGVLIELLETKGDDDYEQRILNFISVNSGDNDVLDTGYFEEVAKRAVNSKADESIALSIKESISSLTSWTDPVLSVKYAEDGRGKLFVFLAAGLLFALISGMLMMLYSAAADSFLFCAFMGIVVIIQTAIAYLFPSTLFGNWKGDYYREKMEWDSFKKFLSDLSQLEKYSPEDINMWGEWLIYGTALGVGKNVEKAMQKLNVNISESGYFYPHYMWYAGFYSISTFSPPSQGGGGGFGAGGGFGGGGAGGR